MQACGVVVEYNPFHNGHQYHIERARETANADCIIAVMSGNFLQRGEPAIIDKYERAKAALASGVDIVLELPYAYAVQSSHYFAMGAVRTLNEIGISALCFGSEQGSIADFLTAYDIQTKRLDEYDDVFKQSINRGLSYPAASSVALQKLTKNNLEIDFTKPNNILGYSYVKRILQDDLPIELLTIRRINNDYHEQTIQGAIASATSIRYELFQRGALNVDIKNSLPLASINALKSYLLTATIWHNWEHYFAYLKYRVLTMTPEHLAMIHLVDEGLENRVIQTAKRAISFNHWMQLVKTKRYTWTRLQRMFVHILTNTLKEDIHSIHHQQTVPYLRLLGFTKTGQQYLNQIKKQVNVPLITQINQGTQLSLALDEKASHTFYTVLPQQRQKQFYQKELQRPIIWE